MKFTHVAKTGLALTSVGLVLVLGVAIWRTTIRSTVVDIPLPLRGQSARPEFTVDFDSLYTFWIQFDRYTDSVTANCLLGRQFLELPEDSVCKSIPPRLEFSWKLSCDGQNIGSGSSTAAGNILRTTDELRSDIVSFHGQKRRKYILAVELHHDGSDVPIFPPKMVVGLDPFDRRGLVWIKQSSDAVGLTLCVVGTIMFLISVARTGLKNRLAQAMPE